MMDMNGFDATAAPGRFRSPLPGIGFCSPWMASKSAGFSHHQLLLSNWGGIGTEGILRFPSLSIPRHIAGRHRLGRVAQATDTACSLRLPAWGCLCHTQHSTQKIPQVGGVAQSSQVTYPRQWFIPLNYLLPKTALGWPMLWYSRYSALKKKKKKASGDSKSTWHSIQDTLSFPGDKKKCLTHTKYRTK